ncbi:MAG: hypothetical protein L6R35_006114, partial [Caloplaca aegaea]
EARWEAFRSASNAQAPTNGSWPSDDESSNDSGPLTREEKKWRKDNYRSEFHFLRIHGLSIYKDEDRNEGRHILRAFMHDPEIQATEIFTGIS